MKTGANFHTNAALLIISAAEKSGLLQEIAQVLRHYDQTHYSEPPGTAAREFCLPCALRDELIEAFEELADLGRQSDFQKASAEELAPYLGSSSSHSPEA
jgi:hypothetical protein